MTKKIFIGILLVILIGIGIWYFMSLQMPQGGSRIIQSGVRPHNYILFRDREAMRNDSAFLNAATLEGAQLVYSWRELEPAKDRYDFSPISSDLAFLQSKGKNLFIQLQDVTFIPSRVNVPQYLLDESQYNGGADKQYSDSPGDGNAEAQGWVARRWDAAVQERQHKLFVELGKAFDGKIEGINLPETSVGFGETGRLFPKGYTPQAYRDAIITNMKALKRAFPRSVALQYANFMPGEWLPEDDKGLLKSVYAAAKEAHVGVGGPDLLPYRLGQLSHAYPLIREAAGTTPTAIAVQEGNYADPDPLTGERPTLEQLFQFAKERLNVDYIFWSTEEPFYSNEVLPFFQ